MRKRLAIIIMAVLAAVSVLLTLGFGVYKISLAEAIGVFFDHLMGNVTNPKADYFIWDVRLPRAIGVVVLGAGLSVAGAVMQNDFRNPLAEPYTMGISSAAFMGVVLAMVAGFSLVPGLTGQSAYTVNAFVFSLVPIGAIILISKFRRLTPVSMILIGIAMMFLFSSVSQILLLATDAETLADAYSWRVGSTSRLDWSMLPIMTVITVIVIAFMYSLSRPMDVMHAGDRGAHSLGVKASRLRIVSLAAVSLMTAAIVSATGTIGFIGLVGPHVARIFVGSKNSYLIPASAAFGALFMAFADTVAKITGPDGLPVGIICSIVGGPLFVYILVKRNSRVWM